MATLPARLTARKSNPGTSVTSRPAGPAAASAASTAASVAGSTPTSGGVLMRPTLVGTSAEAPAKPGSISRMPSSTAATSAPSGPTVSMEVASGYTPSSGIRPQVVFRPAIPQQAAGIRTEPPVSVPRATSASPVATATAEPLDDPARQPSRIQRVHWRAGPRIHPAGRPAQLGEVGLADDPRPGPSGRRHHRRVSGRRARLLRDHLAPGRGGQALDIDAVLDREPRAVSGRVETHDPGGIHGGNFAKAKKSRKVRLRSRRLRRRDLFMSHGVTMRVAIITE